MVNFHLVKGRGVFGATSGLNDGTGDDQKGVGDAALFVVMSPAER